MRLLSPAARPRLRLLVTLLVAALAMIGGSACNLQRKPTKPKPKKTTRVTPKPVPTTTPTSPRTSDTGDLGMAVYPAGTPETGAAIHTWSAKLNPSSYRVGYALAPAERAAVSQSFQAYARSVGFVDGNDGRFKWMPPRECVGDMHCPYENMANRASPDLEPLVERFRLRQRAAGLSALDVGALVVTFVQNIRYEVPRDSPFGILPPALVVAEERGDCDSKSLLGHMLLRSFGIDSVIISSQAHRHAMLAIALPGTGTKMTYQGRQYALTEMTAKGSPIGHVNPPLLRPNDWRVVPIQYRNTPTPTPTPPPPTPKPTPIPRPKR